MYIDCPVNTEQCSASSVTRQTRRMTNVTKNITDLSKTVSGPVPYVLIGAGLPRTGTLSTFTALERLLPGKCHHMARAAQDPGDHDFWLRASRGQLRDEDWVEFIRTSQVSASVDYPMSLYWRDLARLYPEAKVILTVRDPVRWFNSVSNTIRTVINLMQESWLGLPFRLMTSLRRKNPMVAAFTCFAPTYLGPSYPRGMFGAVDCGQETAVRFFTEWREQVEREIPADRLLVFEVKEGWGPLCQFLGVPVPEEPFPNVNDTPSMLRRIRIMKRFCFFLWSLGIAGVGVGGYFLTKHLDIPKLLC